jgi:hypothetical protein
MIAVPLIPNEQPQMDPNTSARIFRDGKSVAGSDTAASEEEITPAHVTSDPNGEADRRVEIASPAQTMTFGRTTSDLSAQQRSKFRVRTVGELAHRVEDLALATYIVEDLIPNRSLTILAGDSGLGKSPLLYQLSLCVASGQPFLGHQVKKGGVLYLDYENGIGQCLGIVGSQARFLDVDKNQENLLLWNLNDSSPTFDQQNETALDIIRLVKPSLVIVDSLGAWRPDIEESNTNALRAFRELRKLISESGTTIIVLHHLRKPSGETAPPPLEEDPRRWFDQVRGARALVNGSDVRLGVEAPRLLKKGKSGDAATEEIALVMGGFARVTGGVGPFYLSRVFDDHGEPLAYRALQGVELLFNAEQEQAFGNFPDSFTFKQAKQVYGRVDQATKDFLNKCMRLNILRHVARGEYQKVVLG